MSLLDQVAGAQPAMVAASVEFMRHVQRCRECFPWDDRIRGFARELCMKGVELKLAARAAR